MKPKLPPIQLPIMAAVLITLLAALWAGLIRVGWHWPVWQPMLPALHGPLMISGFLGALISLERAVAIRKPWTFVGPVLSGIGAVWLVVGLPLPVGQWLLLLGSLGLTAVFLHIIRQHPASYTMTMGLGAVCWLVGNGLWLGGWPIFRIVYWWAGFLVLTIVGERLELSRVARLSANTIRLFGAAVALFMVGLLTVLIWGTWGEVPCARGKIPWELPRPPVRQPLLASSTPIKGKLATMISLNPIRPCMAVAVCTVRTDTLKRSLCKYPLHHPKNQKRH